MCGCVWVRVHHSTHVEVGGHPFTQVVTFGTLTLLSPLPAPLLLPEKTFLSVLTSLSQKLNKTSVLAHACNPSTWGLRTAQVHR